MSGSTDHGQWSVVVIIIDRFGITRDHSGSLGITRDHSGSSRGNDRVERPWTRSLCDTMSLELLLPLPAVVGDHHTVRFMSRSATSFLPFCANMGHV